MTMRSKSLRLHAKNASWYPNFLLIPWCSLFFLHSLAFAAIYAQNNIRFPALISIAAASSFAEAHQLQSAASFIIEDNDTRPAILLHYRVEKTDRRSLRRIAIMTFRHETIAVLLALFVFKRMDDPSRIFQVSSHTWLTWGHASSFGLRKSLWSCTPRSYWPIRTHSRFIVCVYICHQSTQ